MFSRNVTDYIRATANKFLDADCTIQVEETTQDTSPEGYGQNVTEWVNLVTTKCRILPAASVDQQKAIEWAGQESIEEIKRLILPFDTALDVGQRVLVNGKIFYVASLEVSNSDEAFRSAVIVRKAGADG